MTTTKDGTNAPEARRAARRKREAARKRHAEKQARLAKRNAKLYAEPLPVATEPSLWDLCLDEPSATDATPPKESDTAAKAKARTSAKSRTAMPPRMARKKHLATDRIDEIAQSPARARKEISRLNTIVAKLTAQTDKAKPKVRYFDEKWLAARWGMSIKHIRNLRSAGVGPKVTYFGRSVRYRLREVVAFEKANAFASPTDRDQSR